MADDKDKMAGATGLEPAASGVTGRTYRRENKPRFDSLPDNSGAKALRFDSASGKVETIIALLIAAIGVAGIIAAAFLSPACGPRFAIAQVLVLAGCR